MTDNEIIKALEICENYKETCEYCPYDNIRHCADEIRKDTLNLIKIQQAEIEMLKAEQPTGINELLVIVEDDIRAEAIKEFADKVKQNLSFGKYITAEQIDNLAKEMGCGE